MAARVWRKRERERERESTNTPPIQHGGCRRSLIQRDTVMDQTELFKNSGWQAGKFELLRYDAVIRQLNNKNVKEFI